MINHPEMARITKLIGDRDWHNDITYKGPQIYITHNTKNNKLYIGKTINSFKLRYSTRKSTHVHTRALLKHGLEAFNIIIIPCATEKEALNLEAELVTTREADSPIYYNLIIGGCVNVKQYPSEVKLPDLYHPDHGWQRVNSALAFSTRYNVHQATISLLLNDKVTSHNGWVLDPYAPDVPSALFSVPIYHKVHGKVEGLSLIAYLIKYDLSALKFSRLLAGLDETYEGWSLCDLALGTDNVSIEVETEKDLEYNTYAMDQFTDTLTIPERNVVASFMLNSSLSEEAAKLSGICRRQVYKLKDSITLKYSNWSLI